MLDMTGVILEHGDWRAQIVPQGGLLGALDHGGAAVLRRMEAGAVSPLEAACFPMVPWCNRIADGRFRWGNAAVLLARNFMPERHAIHGHGWQSEWTMAELGHDVCVMVHSHEGAVPDWPWAYVAEQTIRLSDAGCAVTLSLTNHSERLMPAGIGLHPYLRRRPGTRVAFQSGQIMAVGADMIPTGGHLPPSHFADFSAEGGAALPEAGPVIDHCYTGWQGAALVSDDCGIITLEAEGAVHLHLYAPRDPSILCLEPVNHLPDAANTGGMPLIAPGETISLTLRIGVA